eukprot:3988369-Amphidinium_carterae.1
MQVRACTNKLASNWMESNMKSMKSSHAMPYSEGGRPTYTELRSNMELSSVTKSVTSKKASKQLKPYEGRAGLMQARPHLMSLNAHEALKCYDNHSKTL